MIPGLLLPLLQDSVQQTASQWMLHELMICILVGARLGGLVVAMPMLSSGLPVRIRVLLVIAMTVVLVPGVVAANPFSGSFLTIPEILFAAIREVIFGMVIGGVVQLLVTGIGLAGELITNVTGMQLAQTADPATGEAVPQLSRLLGLLVTAIMFAAGGHRFLIDAVLTSFRKFPPMSVSIDQTMLAMVVDQLAIAIESGLRIAAPVVACVLLTNIIVAIISRTVPQLNVLAVGLNINLMAALVVLALTIGSVGLVFETELAGAIQGLGLN